LLEPVAGDFHFVPGKLTVWPSGLNLQKNQSGGVGATWQTDAAALPFPDHVPAALPSPKPAVTAAEVAVTSWGEIVTPQGKTAGIGSFFAKNRRFFLNSRFHTVFTPVFGLFLAGCPPEADFSPFRAELTICPWKQPRMLRGKVEMAKLILLVHRLRN
jgi:hypothetical protein